MPICKPNLERYIMKVLIIEDFEPIALAIQKTLNERGHQADCLIGVRSFEPFIGIGLDKQNIDIDPTSYDLVLCDGELYGPNHGDVVVQDLAARGLPCIAISSLETFNDKMVARGAKFGFWKVSAFAALIDGALTAEDCLALSPAVIATVATYKERMRTDEALRSKLDAILMR